MTTDSFEFWFQVDFDQFGRNARRHPDWFNVANDAARTLCQLDARREPHAIELEVVEAAARREVSPLSSCVSQLDALQRVPGPIGQGSYVARWLTQLHAKLRLTTDECGERLRVRVAGEFAVQPAGMLLVDLWHEASQDSAELVPAPDSWMKSIQNRLEQNPLARAGAEYAVAIDLPAEPGLPGRDALIESALQMLEQVSLLLPTTADQTSTLPELWLNLSTPFDRATAQIRLRIWRLGYMQIREKNRIV